jgi:hypothetical protein
MRRGQEGTREAYGWQMRRGQEGTRVPDLISRSARLIEHAHWKRRRRIKSANLTDHFSILELPGHALGHVREDLL